MIPHEITLAPTILLIFHKAIRTLFFSPVWQLGDGEALELNELASDRFILVAMFLLFADMQFCYITEAFIVLVTCVRWIPCELDLWQ